MHVYVVDVQWSICKGVYVYAHAWAMNECTHTLSADILAFLITMLATYWVFAAIESAGDKTKRKELFVGDSSESESSESDDDAPKNVFAVLRRKRRRAKKARDRKKAAQREKRQAAQEESVCHGVPSPTSSEGACREGQASPDLPAGEFSKENGRNMSMKEELLGYTDSELQMRAAWVGVAQAEIDSFVDGAPLCVVCY